jgi:hypothetical protein
MWIRLAQSRCPKTTILRPFVAGLLASLLGILVQPGEERVALGGSQMAGNGLVLYVALEDFKVVAVVELVFLWPQVWLETTTTQAACDGSAKLRAWGGDRRALAERAGAFDHQGRAYAEGVDAGRSAGRMEMEDDRTDPVETHPDRTHPVQAHPVQAHPDRSHPAGDQGVRADRLEACRRSYAERIAAQAGIAAGSEIAAALKAIPVERAEAGTRNPVFLFWGSAQEHWLLFEREARRGVLV